MKKYAWSLLCFAVFLAVSSLANAQIFEPVATEKENKAPATSSYEAPKKTNTDNNWMNNPRRTVNRPNNTKIESSEEPNKLPAKEKKVEILDIPQTQRPTLDGVTRGHVSMQPVLDDNNKEKEDRYIFFYYTDFGVRSTMSGKVLCDVRFVVLSTLDQKINNVSVRLKWANMETPVSFSNVSPNVENYYDYTLLGDGCYTMDKAPNIIVNRCRAKGLSQKDCAEKIRWLRKAR